MSVRRGSGGEEEARRLMSGKRGGREGKEREVRSVRQGEGMQI